MAKRIDLASLCAKLPTDKWKTDQREQRKEIFGTFDTNNNRYLSLAECDRGCIQLLGEDAIPKPVIMRAFQAAKGVAQAHGKNETGHGGDYIELPEFRLFLLYLTQYLELWEIFDEIDTGADHRINFDEFQKALPKLAEWGIKVEDPKAEFETIDANDGGQVLFAEFCDWGFKKSLEQNVFEE